MNKWEKHLIELLISKEIGEIIDIRRVGIFKNNEKSTYNFSFMNHLEQLGFLKCIVYDIKYKKIKNIPNGITYEKVNKLVNNWMSWFVDLDTYFDRQ